MCQAVNMDKGHKAHANQARPRCQTVKMDKRSRAHANKARPMCQAVNMDKGPRCPYQPSKAQVPGCEDGQGVTGLMPTRQGPGKAQVPGCEDGHGPQGSCQLDKATVYQRLVVLVGVMVDVVVVVLLMMMM
ncbi:unnamed protein product, partial [Lampetra planeri]